MTVTYDGSDTVTSCSYTTLPDNSARRRLCPTRGNLVTRRVGQKSRSWRDLSLSSGDYARSFGLAWLSLSQSNLCSH